MMAGTRGHSSRRDMAFQRHPRCLGVRCEDLVAEPERELRRVCDFVGEEYDPCMRKPAAPKTMKMSDGRLINNPNASQSTSAKSVVRWRQDLSVDEGQHFIDIAGELLVALGYVRDHGWVDESFPA